MKGRLTKYLTLLPLLLLLLLGSAARAESVGGATTFVVPFQGYDPEGCNPPVPLGTFLPIDVLITGTTSIYTRQVLAECEDVPELGVMLVFTPNLTQAVPDPIPADEAVTYRLKGVFSHLAKRGEGTTGTTIQAEQNLAGDFTEDNVANVDDFTLFVSVFGMDDPAARAVDRWEQWWRSDLNRSGVVDIDDWTNWSPNFGQSGEGRH